MSNYIINFFKKQDGSCPVEEFLDSLDNITRTLYFFYDGKQIILTNGFVKKTQKTPSAEIQRAKKYRAEYLRLKGDYQ